MMLKSKNINLISAMSIANTIPAHKEVAKVDAVPWYKTNAFIFGTMGTILLIIVIIIATTKK